MSAASGGASYSSRWDRPIGTSESARARESAAGQKRGVVVRGAGDGRGGAAVGIDVPPPEGTILACFSTHAQAHHAGRWH